VPVKGDTSRYRWCLHETCGQGRGPWAQSARVCGRSASGGSLCKRKRARSISRLLARATRMLRDLTGRLRRRGRGEGRASSASSLDSTGGRLAVASFRASKPTPPEGSFMPQRGLNGNSESGVSARKLGPRATWNTWTHRLRKGTGTRFEPRAGTSAYAETRDLNEAVAIGFASDTDHLRSLVRVMDRQRHSKGFPSTKRKPASNLKCYFS
jgi:hypothetical protein